MNATRFAAPARNRAVPAFVTAAIAGWFILATGTVMSEMAAPATKWVEPSVVTVTPEGALKLTVVAKRPHATFLNTASSREISRS